MNLPPLSHRKLWIVDGAFLSKTAGTSMGPDFRVDYKRLRELLERDGPIAQAYYVDTSSQTVNQPQENFYTWLRLAPPIGPKIQTKLFDIKDIYVECPACHHRFTRQVQKGVDVGIAILALTLIDRYDELILTTGDGDFKDLAEYVRNYRNKILTLAVFNSGVSADLQAVSDRIIWLNEFAEQIRKD